MISLSGFLHTWPLCSLCPTHAESALGYRVLVAPNRYVCIRHFCPNFVITFVCVHCLGLKHNAKVGMTCSFGMPPTFGGIVGLLLLLLPGTASAGKAQTPHFKWGQTKELVFLSVMLRDLDKDSISVSLVSEGDLEFKAKNTKGEDHILNLPLREDVKLESLKWEVPARSDKWGTLCTIIPWKPSHTLPSGLLWQLAAKNKTNTQDETQD